MYAYICTLALASCRNLCNTQRKEIARNGCTCTRLQHDNRVLITCTSSEMQESALTRGSCAGGLGDGMSEVAPVEPVRVSTPRELVYAIFEESKHVVITAHLDLTTLAQYINEICDEGCSSAIPVIFHTESIRVRIFLELSFHTHPYERFQCKNVSLGSKHGFFVDLWGTRCCSFVCQC